MFTNLSDFTFANITTCPAGFFLPMKSQPAGPIIIAVDGDIRKMVYLNQEYRFLYNVIGEPDERRGSFGLLFEDYGIEVDPQSIFDANLGDSIGDLVIDQKGVAIVARTPDGWHDAAAIPLRPAFEGAPSLGFGFKSWKIVIGSGAEKQVMWDRSSVNLESDS